MADIIGSTDSSFVRYIRQKFEDFENTYTAHDAGTIDFIAKDIHDLLSKAGVDAAALDETGQTSTKDMEDRIQKAVAGASLVSARWQFQKFENTTTAHDAGTIDFIANNIRGLFKKAGADASALDPTGNYTADQMEKRITATVVRAKSLSNRL